MLAKNKKIIKKKLNKAQPRLAVITKKEKVIKKQVKML